MRKNHIHIVTIALLLAACARDAEIKPAKPKQITAAAENPVLRHSSTYNEAEVIAALAVTVTDGTGLGAVLARNCWATELNRPRVREACVLAWATGNEDSPELDDILRQHGSQSRPLAIAVIRKGSPLKKLAFTELLALLAPLSSDPAWLRARAISAWLSANPDPDPARKQDLWEAVRLPDEVPDPASLGAAYSLASQLGLTWEEELINRYCIPHAAGISQVRCWRFLSALVNPGTHEGPDRKRVPFRPSVYESGWTLFARSFPERALLLEHFWR